MVRRNTPAPPKLRELRLPELAGAEDATIQPHGAYEALRFTGDDLTGVDLSGALFTGCSFAGLNTIGLEMTSTRLTDSSLSRLDVPTVSAAYATLRSTVLEDSRLGVLQCIEGTWEAVHVRNAKLGYVSLRGATLRDVLFTDCVIDELDLTGARAQRVAFPGTELAALDVSGATLDDVDLRALDLPEITGLGHLGGAALDHLQLQQLAPALAAHLGICVED